MDLILVGLGGFLGSITRYKIGIFILKKSKILYLSGTFIINISGAILLGILTALQIKNSTNLFLAEGFLGAYTTFSTFMYEGFNLFSKNKKVNAFFYIIITLLIGIAGFFIGFELVKIIF
ncbi:MAG: fluoride efflux transporter CrcB [Eubacteriales bacterium]